MSKPRTRRHQSPIKGGRDPLPSRVNRDVWRMVEREADKWSVSRSWVVALRLANSYGMDYATYIPQAGKRGGPHG